jgi:hypothetical protein
MIEILILSIMGAAYLTAQLGWWAVLAVPVATVLVMGFKQRHNVRSQTQR